MLRESSDLGDDEQRSQDAATREANKICGVCGDKALGYNFNAVSCESCKAFFRRNALKNKDFRCPFTENCKITPVTRRFCQKCRLDKCFLIGMRKEYIMSEEDKVLKRLKIEENRAKKTPSKKHKGDNSIDESTFDDNSTSIPSIPSVTSAVSEPYFWDSEKKYTDLNPNKQQTVDSLSPVTAASCPSPSSPPENCDIASSKTLEMLKDSSSNSKNNFIKYNHSESFNSANIAQCASSQGNFDVNLCSGLEGNGLCNNGSMVLQKHDFRDIEPTCPKIIKIDDQCSKYTILKPVEEQNIYSKYGECSTSSRILESCSNQNSAHVISQFSVENSSESEKLREVISTVSNTTKVSVNPIVVSKLASNPNVIAKVVQDQGVLAKLFSDPEIIAKLISDPQISQLLEEENITMPVAEEISHGNTLIATKADNKEPANNSQDDIIKKILNDNQSQENPILQNLITTNAEDPQSSSANAGPSSHWSIKSTDEVTRDVLQDVQKLPISANSIESILCEAIKLEFSAYSALGGSHTNRELNDSERAKLNELIVANKALLAPLDDDLTNLVGDDCRFKGKSGQSDPMLLDVINLTAIAIRRLIKMSKKISAFKNMCQEDQLALLKGGCTEMLILRSVINHDPDKDIWKIPHSEENLSRIKVDVLKEAKGNLYAEHSRFVRTFDPKWRDENIILILCAIALFSPERPRVVHSDVIKLEQNSYYYLLRRYLESIYPGCEAKSTFLKLIQKISELHRLNNEVVGVYLNVNPSSVEPLLIEIFDLKH
ncbi:unnamed protein product [Trichogramma brassicae]|uniref:Nuclear hormone receptor HR96 n=1 Tax=Trichogramma brassicae TaxID=86971 RepID=A0A6H5IEZ8_9HYME|nr:unnamed protein product [Trichogramma brassicae]